MVIQPILSDNNLRVLLAVFSNLMRAIARTQASTPATSLMHVKNSEHHFCL